MNNVLNVRVRTSLVAVIRPCDPAKEVVAGKARIECCFALQLAALIPKSPHDVTGSSYNVLWSTSHVQQSACGGFVEPP